MHGAGIRAKAVTFEEGFIKYRSRLIGLAIAARKQCFQDEVPYQYAPDANNADQPVWNDAAMVRNYNLMDLSI